MLRTLGDTCGYPGDGHDVKYLFKIDPFIALTWIHKIKPSLLNYPVEQMMGAPYGPTTWYTNKLAVVVALPEHSEINTTYCIYCHDGVFWFIKCFPRR